MPAPTTTRRFVHAVVAAGFFRLGFFGLGWSAVGGCADEVADPDGAASGAAASEAAPEPVALDLWSGVPPLQPHPGDIAQVIEPRPGPAKPSTVGETIARPFPPEVPPESSRPEVVTGPLEVERFGPTGALDLVDAIRVTFNQPMVPLAAVESLATKAVPLSIAPSVPGKFRWLGTRTVAFVPEGRLPYSTEYTIEVPAGVVSTGGNALGKPVRWTITTPALALASASPYDRAIGNLLDSTVTLTFNQPVQRATLVAALRWRGGGKDVAFTEIDPPDAKQLAPHQRDRVVVLEPKGTLAPNTQYTVSIPAGAWGEGPAKSGAIETRFSTYPPLTLALQPCGGPCYAGNGITLDSSTPIVDPKLADKVHISPAVPNLSIETWGGIHIGGDFTGDTTYTVTVDAGVKDVHGQTLAKPFKKSMRLGPYYPELRLGHAAASPAVVELAAVRQLGLRVAGIDRVEIDAASFGPADIGKFLDVYSYDSRSGWPTDIGTPTWSKSIDVRGSRKTRQDLVLDLDEMLGTARMAWMVARSNEISERGWTWRADLTQLVVVTDLGIAAAVDRDSGSFMVTRLSTGAPVAGVSLAVGPASGKPVWTGTTDAEGLASAEFGPVVLGRNLIVVAEHGDDAAFVRLDRNDIRGQWRHWGNTEDQPVGFFFTDRTPYKPGETIHLVGVLRQQTRGPTGGTAWWRKDTSAPYKVVDPRGVDVATGTVAIGPLGTFTVDIPTKADGGTGTYHFSLEVASLFGPDRSFYHGIPVETFRTPEFTVDVERTDSKALVFGDTLVAEIRGEYLHGAPLVGGAVGYALTRTESDFRPPGSENDAFTFGASGRNWGGLGRGRHGRSGYVGWAPPPTTIRHATGVLDARGKLVVTHVVVADEPPPPDAPPAPVLPPGGPEPLPRAATYTVAATVTDQNRQAIAGSGSFVVHPAQIYVGLRSERTVLREGERTNVEAIAVDLEGARMGGSAVTVDLVRRETTRTPVEKDGRWSFEYATTEVRVGGCALTSAAAPAPCEVSPEQAGSYVARAVTKDAAGHEARTEITLYVHGKDAVVWDESSERRVDLVADRRSYAPGDTARILVRSPFTSARGFVVVEREGIAQQFPIVVEGGAHAVDVPITESMVGGATVSALLTRGRTEVAGAPAGQDLGIPAAAAGQIELDVVTDSKTIVVALEPHATEIEPKASLSLKIKTTRKDGGAPLPAAVAVMVVDEGVLSLMDHQTPDPVAFFHAGRAGEVWLYALQAAVLPRDAGAEAAAVTDATESKPADESGFMGEALGRGAESQLRSAAMPMPSAAPMPLAARARAEEKSAAGDSAPKAGAFDLGAAMAQPVSLRTVFASTAFFDAEIRTDANGEARIDIPMPENLTTFRIMAVAIDPAAADRFGSGESSVRVRKSIMIRPSLPRFANIGDSFEGSVMVDNQSGTAQKVLVGTRGLNVTVNGAAEIFVDIPAGESREVRFDMAVQQVGVMRLQFAAMSSAGRDATEVTVPVHYPATAEAFADYGMTDTSVQRTIEPPPDALPDFGGLELSFSSTALSGLEDAVAYLVDYPYECAEQTASRILPVFALHDILDQFPIAAVRDKALRDKLGNDGIAKLLTHQLSDGGFGFWAADESWPYLTNWVTFALLEGQRRGYSVDAAALGRALDYLENFARFGHRSRWGDYYDWTSRAFALWLLSGEERGAAHFDAVWAHRGEMPLYARVLLMSAAHRYGKAGPRDTVREELRDAVVETARTIHFAEGRSEAASSGLRLLMHSSAQTDAIVLMALLEIDAADPMLPKIIAGIMDDRDPKRGGRWVSTHANAWALLGASRYYEVVEKDPPDFTAQVWLDALFAGEHTFRGRSMAKVDQKISMQTLQGAKSRALTVAKSGVGKLYYRIGLRYAPKGLDLAAIDQGFTVYRTYEALPGDDGKVDPAAVVQTEDGDYRVKAGTNVKVTLNLVVADRANYVVVDDPLPAGFEGQNSKFVTSVAPISETTGSRGGGDGWWWGWWYSFSHTDLRDDRMLLFADQLAAGVYTYSYTARATTIGDFLLPPVKAEEMYEPERFGHGSSARVTVVE